MKKKNQKSCRSIGIERKHFSFFFFLHTFYTGSIIFRIFISQTKSTSSYHNRERQCPDLKHRFFNEENPRHFDFKKPAPTKKLISSKKKSSFQKSASFEEREEWGRGLRKAHEGTFLIANDDWKQREGGGGCVTRSRPNGSAPGCAVAA